MEPRHRGKNLKARKSEDIELLQKRKFRRKCQFRAYARLVYQNAYWLQMDIAEVETDDVKKRVAQAMQKKKEKKLLTIKDKILLNKPAAERTEEEKKYLYRIIGGLKCFNGYPNHVKKKLAGVTYFKYFGPNRVIIREKHPGQALYFIVTGDVKVSQLVFDELLREYQSVDLRLLHAGDLFGEIALLHNIPRCATCTTLTDCEFLVLWKDDFKSILQWTLQATWDRVQNAMTCFPYFDSLDAVSCREGCIVAKMKSYARNDVILGDGRGLSTYVYFVLQGHCQMIQELKVIAIPGMRRTHYKLYDPHVSMTSDINNSVLKMYTQENSTEIQIPQSNRDATDSKIRYAKSRSKESGVTDSKLLSDVADKNYEEEEEEYDVKNSSYSTVNVLCYQSQATTTTRSGIYNTDELPAQESMKRLSFRIQKLPESFHSVFMQVCQYNPGSTFGIGEDMEDRRIIALTRVECLLMPIVWLQQHNSVNIWTRIKHYLTKNIPNKKQLFEAFKNEQRWNEFKEEVVEDVVARAHVVNCTSIHDVPYSIRLEEMINI